MGSHLRRFVCTTETWPYNCVALERIAWSPRRRGLPHRERLALMIDPRTERLSPRETQERNERKYASTRR